MIRKLLMAAALVGLVACKPAADAGKAGATPAPAAATAPSGDWYVTIAPDSNSLDFRASAEATASAFSLACVPGSDQVSVAKAATLSSGGHSGTYTPGAAVAAADPVFDALRATGSVVVTQDGNAATLRGSPEGKFAVQAFFQFCRKPA